MTPSVANFVLIHFPDDQGPNGRRRPTRFLTKRGLILRQVERLQAAERAAHERRHRRGQPARGASARRIPGEAGVSKPAPLFNRLALIGVGLIGSSIARAARAQGAVRTIVATARSPQTRRRVAELRSLPIRWWRPMRAAVEGADLVDRLHPGRRLRRVAREIGAHLAARRDRFRCRLGQRARSCAIWRRTCRRPCTSSRRIPSPAPNIQGPTQALPSCSSTAGAS